MSNYCGCWYQLPTDPNTQTYWRFQINKQYLPLVEAQSHTTILSTTSRTVLKQTFKNPSTKDAIKECTYSFPLYDGVAVVSFTCRVGMKVLRGLVKEKTKAKEIYDDAVAKGEVAGLLQQASEASDMFSTKLGNIPAGESVIVEVTYIGELKHHDTEGIRFTIPTKIAPRYGSTYEQSSPGEVTAKDHGGIQIVVDVNMPEGSSIKGIQSPSHPIAVSMGTVSTAATADPTLSKASATLSLGTAALEKDFVLIIQSKDIGIPKAILETHPTLHNHRALMATLVPKFSLPPSRPEIVFVADRSGSMQSNIPMLISAMNVFLKSMPPGVKFNICSFGTSSSFLWEKSQSYTKDTLQQSTSHVQTFAANMGGTETFGAIKSTIERRWGDIPLEVILLTDGDIARQNQLFAYVNQEVDGSKGKIRIFTLGIGNGVSHALTEGLARAGNGFAQAVQEGERLEKSVVRMLRGALTPHITDYTLEVKYEKDDDDFEAVDEVIEGLKVLLSDSDKPESAEQETKPAISLFDMTVDPEKDSVKGSKDSSSFLPKVPTPKLLQAPNKIPSLFAFSRTSVYLLMSPETIQRNPTAVVLRATCEHGPLALEIPIEVLSAPGETIHQLAAKKAVQDLEEGRGWIYEAKDQAGTLVKDVYPSCFEDLVEKEAVRLGEKFQIAGKWCSFVAVSANDKEIADKTKEAASKGSSEEEYDIIDYSDEEAHTPLRADARYITPASPTTFSPAQRQRMFKTRSHSNSATQSLGQQQSYQGALFGSSSAGPNPFQSRGQSSIAFGSGAAAPITRGGPAQQMQMHYQPGQIATQMYSTGYTGPTPFDSSTGSAPPPPPPRGFASISMGGSFGSYSPPPGARTQEDYITPYHAAAPSPSSTSPTRVDNLILRKKSRASSARVTSPPYSPASPSYSPASPSYSPAPPSSLPPPPDVQTPVAASPLPPITTPGKVLALIALQDFDGFWPATSAATSSLLGLSDVKPQGPEGKSNDIWMTLLVIAFLKEKCAEEEGTWELVVEKARAWLVDEAGVKDLAELEKQAAVVIRAE